ncbi:MAG: NADP(H)-dependent aldo-keto reductase [Sideroxydans sp.]|nr:NADP(H)-dependent aldo-keto reductase [Sideroxydans sp.]
MKYNPLGSSNLSVSETALGTMTFGEQNTLDEACAQLDYAVAQGVNFIDTAEMYPVPGRPETQGRTEEYVGHWLKRQPRDKFIIATKVTGPARGFDWIRNGPQAIDRANITAAIEGSLQRLQTDYVDLYQIHWPDRNVPMFGRSTFEPERERPSTPVAEQLTVLSELVQSGKVRHIGLSNETPWGIAEFLKVAQQLGLQRVVSVQNPYNLISRTFELGLHEMCYREQVGLLVYSPLAFGLLSGKYADDAQAAGRMTLFPNFGQRYHKPNVPEAVAAYARLAREHGLSPAAMALAFVRSRPFATSTIIGATTMQQLKESLTPLVLGRDTLQAIDEIHARYNNPAP